ncbi:unnamed protein product [Symbiodinium natans]|uniref:Uncharacterized protein n=1 Tax=Symbiodinium natans TaxID=878477 RepID=A0A812PS42_9DINO|nr:unnamed protein product [Symbiodinium natans]
MMHAKLEQSGYVDGGFRSACQGGFVEINSLSRKPMAATRRHLADVLSRSALSVLGQAAAPPLPSATSNESISLKEYVHAPPTAMAIAGVLTGQRQTAQAYRSNCPWKTRRHANQSGTPVCSTLSSVGTSRCIRGYNKLPRPRQDTIVPDLHRLRLPPLASTRKGLAAGTLVLLPALTLQTLHLLRYRHLQPRYAKVVQDEWSASAAMTRDLSLLFGLANRGHALTPSSRRSARKFGCATKCRTS